MQRLPLLQTVIILFKKVDTTLKNGYSGAELFSLINSFEFLTFGQKQFINGQIRLFIGMKDQNAEKEIKKAINEILNETHPVIHLKHQQEISQ